MKHSKEGRRNRIRRVVSGERRWMRDGGGGRVGSGGWRIGVVSAIVIAPGHLNTDCIYIL
jgi:hypothetical protein